MSRQLSLHVLSLVFCFNQPLSEVLLLDLSLFDFLVRALVLLGISRRTLGLRFILVLWHYYVNWALFLTQNQRGHDLLRLLRLIVLSCLRIVSAHQNLFWWVLNPT
jgi:hypothetical protein